MKVNEDILDSFTKRKKNIGIVSKKAIWLFMECINIKNQVQEQQVGMYPSFHAVLSHWESRPFFMASLNKLPSWFC